jgi:predicted Zn-dependent protease
MQRTSGIDTIVQEALLAEEARPRAMSPPPFLSTHPANEERVRALTERMPEAMKLYGAAGKRGLQPDCQKS